MRRAVSAPPSFAKKYGVFVGARLEIVREVPGVLGKQYVVRTEDGRTIGPVAADQFPPEVDQ